MSNINLKDVPNGYSFCVVSDCQMASHCLRQRAMQVLDDSTRIVRIVNPKRTQPSENCEFYSPDVPVVFARGFEGMQEEMLPRQYNVFMNRLKQQFGRTGYFERRRGDRRSALFASGYHRYSGSIGRFGPLAPLFRWLRRTVQLVEIGSHADSDSAPLQYGPSVLECFCYRTAVFLREY